MLLLAILEVQAVCSALTTINQLWALLGPLIKMYYLVFI